MHADKRRLLWTIVLTGLLAVTLYFNAQTVRAVLHSGTNGLWRDQWWFVGELQSVYEGKNWAEVLWSPYWGHRPVLGRLLFYLDARLFSFRNGPLVCLAWAALLTQIFLLAAVNRKVFGSVFGWRFAAALVVLLSLCLSSFQMENLIWALQVQYVLVFFFATVSFAALPRWALLSCLSALAGSLTMAHGLLIWPVLAIQAYVCRRDRRIWIGFLTAFVVLVAIYSVGYQMPDTGMSLRGQFKRPMRALEIALMVLGGSISNRSLAWGVAAGGIGAASVIVFAAMLKRSSRPEWPCVYLSLALFTAATASLTAAGRISPELLKVLAATGNELLPSRYQTFGYLFWVSVFTLALWFGQSLGRSKWRFAAVPALAMPVFMAAADARQQGIASQAWVDLMHSNDATNTAFLLDAPDWERQQTLWSDAGQLRQWAAFLKVQRLGVFSEERSGWLHSAIEGRFRMAGSERCEGRMETVAGARVTGWAWDRDARKPPQDVVLTDAGNGIIGLARSGLGHHDTGGHTGQVVIWRAGWLGYYRAGVPPAKAFAVLGDGRTACALR